MTLKYRIIIQTESSSNTKKMFKKHKVVPQSMAQKQKLLKNEQKTEFQHKNNKTQLNRAALSANITCTIKRQILVSVIKNMIKSEFIVSHCRLTSSAHYISRYNYTVQHSRLTPSVQFS